MAYFMYEASYQGRNDSNVAKDLTKAINNAKKRLDSQNYNASLPEDFEAAFKTFIRDGIVIYGIASQPGKAKDTKVLRMEFNGKEKNILEVKLRLTKNIKGLELL